MKVVAGSEGHFNTKRLSGNRNTDNGKMFHMHSYYFYSSRFLQ